MGVHPTLALRVTHLPDSLSFYVEQLGFPLIQHDADADVAIIRDSDGDPLLLAGPSATALTAWLAPQHRVLTPGSTLSFQEHDFAGHAQQLAQRDIAPPRIQETPWGDRALIVTDPDRYQLQFWAYPERTIEAALTIYESTANAFEAALAGLAEAEYDLALPSGELTIRQIIFHVADADALYVHAMRMALFEPQRTFVFNWPSSSARPLLDPRTRNVDESLALIRTSRAYVVGLARLVPDLSACGIQDQDGNPWSFERLLNVEISHALEHVDEIARIRQYHKR